MSHAPTPSPRAGQTAPGAAGQTAVDPNDPNYLSSSSDSEGADPWAASSPVRRRAGDLLQDFLGALTGSRAHGGDGAGETAPAPRDAGQQTARGDDGAGGSLTPQGSSSPKEWSCKLVDLLPPTGRMQYLFGPGTVGDVEVRMPLPILEHKLHTIFTQMVAMQALNRVLEFGGQGPQRSLNEALRECRAHRLVEGDAYYVLKGLNLEANAAKHGEKRSRQPADSPRRRPRRR